LYYGLYIVAKSALGCGKVQVIGLDYRFSVDCWPCTLPSLPKRHKSK